MGETTDSGNTPNSVQEDVNFSYHIAIGYLLNTIENRIKVDPNGAYYHRDTMMSEDEVKVLDYLFGNAILVLNRNIMYCFSEKYLEVKNLPTELSTFGISYIETRQFSEKIMHVETVSSDGDTGTIEISTEILTNKDFFDIAAKEVAEERIADHDELKRLLKKFNYSAKELERIKNE